MKDKREFAWDYICFFWASPKPPGSRTEFTQLSPKAKKPLLRYKSVIKKVLPHKEIAQLLRKEQNQYVSGFLMEQQERNPR